MKKLLNSLLALLGLVVLVGILFVPGVAKRIDKAVLLEEQRPAYAEWLLKASKNYVDADAAGSDAYLLTHVSKDGFGAISPEDIRFYLKASRNSYPGIVRASLRFSDGTGLEIPVDLPETVKYGVIDASGVVTDVEKTVALAEPLLCQIDGLTVFEREYDQAKNVTYQFRLDANGEAVPDSTGVAGFCRSYDADGNIVMSRQIGVDKEPLVNSLGYAEVRREYDGKDLIWEAYYDAAGEPVARTDTLYASIVRAYDGAHHCIQEQYYDAAGQPVCTPDGYAEMRREYDGKLVTQISYYGTDGKPLELAAGYASLQRSYNEAGKVASESYYDVAGQPVMCINGYTQIAYEYDEAGNIAVIRYLDVAGKPVVAAVGYAEVQRVYDEDRLIRESYFDALGQPMLQPAGYAQFLQEWSGDQLVSRVYLDADGAPVRRADGYATASWVQDAAGVWDLQLADLAGNGLPMDGVNLATDVHFGADGWSVWMVPRFNIQNSCYGVGYMNLGEKAEGDVYSCQIEIEFKDVTATEGQELRFWAQGAQDRQWGTGNVWNGALVNLTGAPADGVYRYTSSVALNADMAKISRFDIGFRCDYWASGMFRVRSVKVEKGDTATEWTPGI